MVLDNNLPSLFEGLIGMGANPGAFFYFKKERKFDEKEIEEIIQANNKEGKILNDLLDKIVTPILMEFLENIPLPRRFTKMKIIDHVRTLLFEELQTKRKTMKKGWPLIEKIDLPKLFTLFFNIAEKVKKNEKTVLKQELPKLLNQFEETFTHLFEFNVKSAINTRSSFEEIFLNSDFPPEFIMSLSKMCNVLVTFYEYVKNEISILFCVINQMVQDEEDVSKLRFNLFPNKKEEDVLFIQFNLYLMMIELLLFIEIWHTENIEQLFRGRIEKLSVKNIHKKFFMEQLTKINQEAEELHYIVLDSSFQKKRTIPYTLEKDSEINEKEKELIANFVLT